MQLCRFGCEVRVENDWRAPEYVGGEWWVVVDGRERRWIMAAVVVGVVES